ncbi:GTPase KRas [Pelomyxa schiedti]|nr:GTPase KRas [Pelomyxa schiedti]
MSDATSTSSTSEVDADVPLVGQMEVIPQAEGACFPASRSCHVAAANSSGLVVFGGLGDTGLHCDTWEFTFASMSWKKTSKAPTKNHPQPRGRQHASVVCYMGEIYMFGGDCGEGVNNELWRYNTRSMWNLVQFNNSAPPPTWGHSAVVFHDNMLVYGGNTSSGPTSDLYRFSFSKSCWEQLSASNSPPPQMFHSSALFGNRLYVLTASKSSDVAPAFYCLDLESLMWSQLQSPPVLGLLRGTSLLCFSAVIVLFGGKLKNGISNELWCFQITTGLWKSVTMNRGLVLPKLYFHSAIEWGNCLWIFGGIGNKGSACDLVCVTAPHSTEICSRWSGAHDSFSAVPEDVMFEILAYLQAKDLGRMCAVSLRIRRLASENSLWRSHVEALLKYHAGKALYPTCSPLPDVSTDWRELYYHIMFRTSFYYHGEFLQKESSMQNLRARHLVSYNKHAPQFETTMVVFGEEGVGKSALTIALITNHFVDEYDPEIMDSYRRQTTEYGVMFLMDILDTTNRIGPPEQNYINHHVLKAVGFIVIYSVTDASSFAAVDKIVNGIGKSLNLTEPYGPSWPSIVLCANKCDLAKARVVSTNEGLLKAMKIGCPYIETSCRDRKNILETFLTTVLEAARLTTLSMEGTLPTTKSKCLVM